MRRGTRAALIFFFIGFCTCLLLTGIVRFATGLEWPFGQKQEKKHIEVQYYPQGHCPHCKKISQRFWNVDKLNDDNNAHLEAAVRCGITPFMTNADFRAKVGTLVESGKLVELKGNDYYQVKSLSHSFPYLVPSASVLLDEIGARFTAKLDTLEIGPHIMQVSSVLRTLESQDGLGKRNSNAAPFSAHMYGTTFDISYKEFIPLGGEKVKEGFCRHDLMRHVLGEVLTEMRREGRCMVVIERKQACYHITVATL